MCPKIEEKLRRPHKAIRLSVKLDACKLFDPGERNMCTLNMPASFVVFTHRKRILKADEVTTGSASSKMVSFTRHPVMDEMEGLAWVK